MSTADSTSSIKSQSNDLHFWELSYWRLRLAEFRKDPEATKIFMMRVTLCLFLVGAAAGISISAHNLLQESQQKSFESDYYSVAENALQSVKESFSRLNSGVLQLSRLYGELYPDQDTWPNVAWSGFHSVTGPLRTTSSIEGLGIFPLVLPHQVEAYNNHTLEYYLAHPDEYETFFPIRFFPNGSIFMQNNSQVDPTPYDVTNGIVPPYKFFAPVVQYTISALAGNSYVGYDIHADPRYVGGVQSVINCTNTYNDTRSLTSCAGITEVTPMPWYSIEEPDPVIDDMMAVFIHPIFPASNHSKLVGFAGGSLSWATTLTNIVPSFAHNIDCVVQAHDWWFTFTMMHGTPVFKGFGDLHEQKFSKYKIQSRALSPSLNEADENSHWLTLYPTQEFHDAYHNDSPLLQALGLVAVFVLCAFLFYIYDLLMKREFSRRQAVLDTKRRFVRFISHEIRTPLNTVRLGLKLFEEELNRLLEKVDRIPPAELSMVTKSTLTMWKGLTEEILESSDSAVEVLDDLLNYDKIEIGTLRLEFGLIDMRELMMRSAALMQPHATQKGVTLVLQYHPEGAPYDPARQNFASVVSPISVRDTPGVGGLEDISTAALLEEGREQECMVIGDAARLSQVLRNLMSNALKFTPPKGTVTVTVSTVRAVKTIPEKVRQSGHLFQSMDPIGTVSIAVTDSGAGLSSLQLLQICKEGVQFNANELQAGQGSGLGLFISKGIVEQHGGALSVSSEGVGKGATFCIELPMYPAKRGRHPVVTDTSTYAKYRDTPASPTGPDTLRMSLDTLQTSTTTTRNIARSKKILVVDDSPFNRKMLVRLMTSRGFDCAQAEDGADAVRVYQDMAENGHEIEFMLMDFEMPVMNGPTATKKLRELGCKCLIVGVTGNVLPDQVATFKSHGADAVLPKPLVIEDLQYLLDTHHRNNPITPKLHIVTKKRSVSAKTSAKIVPTTDGQDER